MKKTNVVGISIPENLLLTVHETEMVSSIIANWIEENNEEEYQVELNTMLKAQCLIDYLCLHGNEKRN